MMIKYWSFPGDQFTCVLFQNQFVTANGSQSRSMFLFLFAALCWLTAVSTIIFMVRLNFCLFFCFFWSPPQKLCNGFFRQYVGLNSLIIFEHTKIVTVKYFCSTQNIQRCYTGRMISYSFQHSNKTNEAQSEDLLEATCWAVPRGISTHSQFGFFVSVFFLVLKNNKKSQGQQLQAYLSTTYIIKMQDWYLLHLCF